MNLAVRRRLADLRTVLFWGANSPSRKRQVQKNRDEVRKMSKLHGVLFKNAKFHQKHEKSPAKCKAYGADNQI